MGLSARAWFLALVALAPAAVWPACFITVVGPRDQCKPEYYGCYVYNLPYYAARHP
jgi:hypothetical protein